MSKSRAADFSDPNNIVGYTAEVSFSYLSGKPVTEKQWLGSEANAIRKARMLRNFHSILSLKPVTAATWLRAYGVGRM